jgi:hypothetical protein
MSEVTHILLDMGDKGCYAQRCEPQRASVDPLTSEEEALLFAIREIERLKSQLNHARLRKSHARDDLEKSEAKLQEVEVYCEKYKNRTRFAKILSLIKGASDDKTD